MQLGGDTVARQGPTPVSGSIQELVSETT